MFHLIRIKKDEAVTNISEARGFLQNLVKVTADHIPPSQLAITEDYFHWKNYQGEVDAGVEQVKQQQAFYQFKILEQQKLPWFDVSRKN